MSASAVGADILLALRITVIAAFCFISLTVIAEGLARAFRALADFLNAVLRGAILLLAALIRPLWHWRQERQFRRDMQLWKEAALPPTATEAAEAEQRRQQSLNIKWALIVAIAWGCAMALTLLANALHIPLN